MFVSEIIELIFHEITLMFTDDLHLMFAVDSENEAEVWIKNGNETAEESWLQNSWSLTWRKLLRADMDLPTASSESIQRRNALLYSSC